MMVSVFLFFIAFLSCLPKQLAMRSYSFTMFQISLRFQSEPAKLKVKKVKKPRELIPFFSVFETKNVSQKLPTNCLIKKETSFYIFLMLSLLHNAVSKKKKNSLSTHIIYFTSFSSKRYSNDSLLCTVSDLHCTQCITVFYESEYLRLYLNNKSCLHQHSVYAYLIDPVPYAAYLLFVLCYFVNYFVKHVCGNDPALFSGYTKIWQNTRA